MLSRQHENPTALMFASRLKEAVKVAVPRSALVLMLRCLLDVPEARPDMVEVAGELSRVYGELVKGGEANEELKMEVSPVPTLEELLRPVSCFFLLSLIWC